MNYELLWKQLKEIINRGDITFEGNIVDGDLLRVMEILETDERL